MSVTNLATMEEETDRGEPFLVGLNERKLKSRTGYIPESLSSDATVPYRRIAGGKLLADSKFLADRGTARRASRGRRQVHADRRCLSLALL
jgi:hypothetical protein